MHPYATLASATRGRMHAEDESARRSPFQRDRDRIIHSTAFRRLKHKTQVFVFHEGDHFRTRLTHSIEVAQIARSIARALGLDEDLAEGIALAHDLGHPPFGHAGEDALEACMAAHGGFDHNEQTFRAVTLLERHYAEFDGLNLTWETLEGIVKHNGPLVGPGARAKSRAHGVPATIADFSRAWDLELDRYAGAEAQVAAISDDIAYNNHDLDDGLRAGLFTLDDLADVPLAGPIIEAVRARYPKAESSRQTHESIRRMIDLMVNDVIEESEARLRAGGIARVEDIRGLGRSVVDFSDGMRENDLALKRFLFQRMYRHDRVNAMSRQAREVIHQLFQWFVDDPAALPREWRAPLGNADSSGTVRAIADYIAGMTDKYAIETNQRLSRGGTGMVP